MATQQLFRLIDSSPIQIDHGQIAQCPGLAGQILDAPCQLQAFGVERHGELQIAFPGCNETEPGEGQRLPCRLTKVSEQPEALLTSGASTLAFRREGCQEEQDIEQHVGNAAGVSDVSPDPQALQIPLQCELHVSAIMRCGAKIRQGVGAATLIAECLCQEETIREAALCLVEIALLQSCRTKIVEQRRFSSPIFTGPCHVQRQGVPGLRRRKVALGLGEYACLDHGP